MNKAHLILSKFRRAFGALFVCTVVVVIPVLSIYSIGSFISNERDSRGSQPLEPMAIRPVDYGKPSPRLFEEPLITVTFDDGHETTYSVAMPILQKHGIPTTQYLLSDTANDEAYVSWKQMYEMQKAGHEIACHSADHSNLVTLTDDELDYQLGHCKRELSKRFGAIRNFASPYGSQNQRTLKTIGKYFATQRNTVADVTNGVTEEDVNVRANFDPIDIIGFTVRSDTTVEQLRELVAYTKAHNGWLVLTYHQADDDSSEYSVTKEEFERQFSYLSGTDVRIVTVQQAMQSLALKGAEY